MAEKNDHKPLIAAVVAILAGGGGLWQGSSADEKATDTAVQMALMQMSLDQLVADDEKDEEQDEQIKRFWRWHNHAYDAITVLNQFHELPPIGRPKDGD